MSFEIHTRAYWFLLAVLTWHCVMPAAICWLAPLQAAGCLVVAIGCAWITWDAEDE